jgi:cystathionine beta-lyase/cystathionine gamma-synthase
MTSPQSADAALAGEEGSFVYRRDGHPNERSLATKLGQLHSAAMAMVTGQGMSAIAATALALLKPKARVAVASELYGKTLQMFSVDLARWGVEHHSFDPTDEPQLAELARSNTDLVFVETLSNPRLRLPDLQRLARVTHEAGGLLAVDNTFATHLLCKPLELGADIVIESLSKQVNGHSDAMLGLVATRDADIGRRIQSSVSTFGLASSPLDCFLTHRGLTTLALRIDRACQNAMQLARRLSELPQVTQVDYPGLESHPQHSKCLQQLKGGFGWMLSFNIDSDWNGVRGLFEKLAPDIPFLPSLGDICTSVSHPSSTSHRGLTPQARKELGITDGTIRVSCGVEPSEWLADRFCQSLSSRD